MRLVPKNHATSVPNPGLCAAGTLVVFLVKGHNISAPLGVSKGTYARTWSVLGTVIS